MEELEVGGEGESDGDDGEMAAQPVVPVRDDAICCFRAHSGVWCGCIPFRMPPFRTFQLTSFRCFDSVSSRVCILSIPPPVPRAGLQWW